MKYWRTITIGNEKYRWRYFYDHLEFSHYPFSYLLICPHSNRKNEIRLVFNKLEPPMLLPGFKGEPASRNGEYLSINLNEPKYIREIIVYLLNEIVSFNEQDKWVFNYGEDLLRKLGYTFGDLASDEVVDKIKILEVLPLIPDKD